MSRAFRQCRVFLTCSCGNLCPRTLEHATVSCYNMRAQDEGLRVPFLPSAASVSSSETTVALSAVDEVRRPLPIPSLARTSARALPQCQQRPVHTLQLSDSSCSTYDGGCCTRRAVFRRRVTLTPLLTLIVTQCVLL